ncbi:MAG: SDR family oxidoreductase [Capsulimonadales bacterium]|nr:SDR family oxidoreductase [Capsulimonadales bacterium]
MSYEYQPLDLNGKGVLITGGTTGIGRATAERLARAGARIFVFGRHEAELRDALTHLRAHGSVDVHGMTADTARQEDVLRVFEAAEPKIGPTAILINNAALPAQGVQEMTPDEWRYVIDANLSGYVAFAQEAAKRMKEQGGGHIVNVGSLSAKVREKGSSVYVATKAGIEGFSEAFRKEVNEFGIKVTLIEPGLVGTDMTAENTPVEKQPAKAEAGEMLKAEDIAECIFYTLTQPERCDVIEVRIRPHRQEI